jgi:hypothetical protein
MFAAMPAREQQTLLVPDVTFRRFTTLSAGRGRACWQAIAFPGLEAPCLQAHVWTVFFNDRCETFPFLLVRLWMSCTAESIAA